MDEANGSARVVRFGDFEADLQTAELRKSGVRVPLQGQPFQVCAILLSRSGELVTREELRQKVWPDDTFVDFDQALNTSIAKIRIALGDDADNPRFVETLPRRGYRFIAPVDKPSSQIPKAGGSRWRLKGHTAAWTLLGGGAALFALLSGIGISRLSRNRGLVPLPQIEVLPLAGLSGFEAQPAFSPDGNHVAFVLHATKNSGIYTTMIGSEKSLRLTSNSGDCCPTWSPNGREIAFSRLTDGGVDIYVIPAFGGTEHRLFSWPPEGHQISPFPMWRVNSRSLDWSADGKVLAFSDNQADKTHAWIALLSLIDSTIRRLTSPSSQNLDYGPAFSPDGSTVAFVRGIATGVVEDLYVVPTAGGAPKRLTFDNTWIYGPPAWTPDGRDIVFSSTRGGLASLWRISASGGTPRPVPGGGVVAAFPSISRKGNQLAYQQMENEVNIWRLNLRDEKHRQGPPAVVISQKGGNSRPHFSPDGKRIAFESDRLGYAEIWVCDSDGSNCGQLTSLRGTSGAARWSPDGKYIAFEYRPKEHSEVYLLEVASGVPRLLTTLPGADNGGPNWSRDGEWIYFCSDRGGGPFQLWKIQLSGGTPIQVTRNGGVFAAESDDGRFLYYSKYETPGVWKMPLNGGDEIHILDQPPGERWWNWSLARNGIYFFGSNNLIKSSVNFFDFASSKKILLAAMDRPSVGVAVSPDGKSILYVQNDQEGELFGRYEWANSRVMLVKNFR
jgi:Tol biopolymer transport system component/DNA-binding winged helix-turn-helix (wHTH) protein